MRSRKYKITCPFSINVPVIGFVIRFAYSQSKVVWDSMHSAAAIKSQSPLVTGPDDAVVVVVIVVVVVVVVVIVVVTPKPVKYECVSNGLTVLYAKFEISLMTSSNGNIFCVTGHLCREFTGHRWIPSKRPVTRLFDVSLICACINGWVNNREAGDLRRHRARYDVTVVP